MTHTFFMSDDQVTLINLSNGNRVVIHKDDKRFITFCEAVSNGDFVTAEMMDVKSVITSFADENPDFMVEIRDGVGTIFIYGKPYPMNKVITDKIIKLKEQGFSAIPIINFLQNLYENPSKVAIDELFLFLEKAELPITEDGYFIAYKVVRDDYKDIHSGTFDNSVGQVCSMPRFAVDDNRSNTCSSGLHFCSRDYLQSFGSQRKDTDRCMLLKINPANVVSIPSDYANTKGRTCAYEVVGEVTNDNWRDTIKFADFTDKAVYSFDSEDDSEDDCECNADCTLEDDLDADGYFFNNNTGRWHDEFGRMVSRRFLADKFGVSVDVIVELE